MPTAILTADTADTATMPASICWNMEHGYMLQVGDGDDREWFDLDGDQIDRSALLWEIDGKVHETFKVARSLGHFDNVSDALARLYTFYSPHGYDIINLAGDEWGNETMRRVAREHFEANADCIFCEIREHAGWHLSFRRDLSIWGTANDRAVFDKPWPRPAYWSDRHIIRTTNALRTP